MVGIAVVSQICFVTVEEERGSEVVVIDRYKGGEGLKNIKSSVTKRWNVHRVTSYILFSIKLFFASTFAFPLFVG